MQPTRVLLALALCGCSGAPIGELEEGLSVCAPGPVTRGMDVSHYDGTIDWPTARAGGFAFAIMKATEQTSYVDPTFAGNWKAAGAAGVIRGAYHFFRPSYDPIQQADFFLATTGAPAPGDLPPTLDLEVLDSLTGAQVAAAALAFLERVQQQTGRTPIVYTSARVMTELGDPAGFEPYTLWVANWQVSCPKIPSPEWSAWTIWQDSSTGTVPGISGMVDLDQFNGPLDALQAFASGVTAKLPVAAGADEPDAGDATPPPATMMQAGCDLAGREPNGWLLGLVLLTVTGTRLRSARRTGRAGCGSPARALPGARGRRR